MIESYSQNVTVLADSAIPFNSTSIQKGCTSIKSGTTTFELNKCGVYMVSFDVSVIATEIGEISIQLRKDGVLQPQAITEVTAADTTSIHPLSFVTLVQVKDNNSCKCCDGGVTIEIVNTGVGITASQANVVITKIC